VVQPLVEHTAAVEVSGNLAGIPANRFTVTPDFFGGFASGSLELGLSEHLQLGSSLALKMQNPMIQTMTIPIAMQH
jgi:hypothetical protein